MSLAIIRTGGKQYIVSPGKKIKIDPSAALQSGKQAEEKEAKEINFGEVLLAEKNKKLEIGAPLVKGAKVLAKIVSQGKGKKMIAFKYKSKTRRKTKKGHRQPFMIVEVEKINME